VEETARDAATRARRLLELREAMLQQADPALVDQLLVNPYIAIGKAASVLRVTHPTATKVLRKLEASGMLKEITRRNWGKVYVAAGVLVALEPSTKTD
jgi:Fic family protein